MVSKERLNLSVYWSLSIIASPCVKTNMSVAGQDFETRCQDVQPVLDDAFCLLVPPQILAGQKFFDVQKKSDNHLIQGRGCMEDFRNFAT